MSKYYFLTVINSNCTLYHNILQIWQQTDGKSVTCLTHATHPQMCSISQKHLDILKFYETKSICKRRVDRWTAVRVDRWTAVSIITLQHRSRFTDAQQLTEARLAIMRCLHVIRGAVKKF